MTTRNLRIPVSILAFALTAAVVGCKSESKPKWSINDDFQPDNQPRHLDGYYNQQVANGARQDGTLYAHHFTGGELNALGQQKLDAMLYGPDVGKLAIYLSIEKDAQYASRESSVVTFLANKGLASNTFEITPGANPAASAPAVHGLVGLEKQSRETTTSSGQGAGSMSK